MPSESSLIRFGWLRDYPEFRDCTAANPVVSTQLEKMNIAKPRGNGDLPASVDLSEWCSPVEYQENLGSCTAHAGVGLIEYFQRKSFGRHEDMSRLFLYKVTRNLMRMTGDTGAYLRSTMKAMVAFGVPPEEYWPYLIEQFDEEPPAFCYSFAKEYKTITYYRLDEQGVSRQELLNRIKTNLAAGLPSMFGFTVYSSIERAMINGLIPFPRSSEDKVRGGHAVMAVGYDDNLEIPSDGPPTKGAFKIRNSWKSTWGQQGYGWLPYEYVLQGLAEDWWSLIKSEWIDTQKFGI